MGQGSQPVAVDDREATAQLRGLSADVANLLLPAPTSRCGACAGERQASSGTPPLGTLIIGTGERQASSGAPPLGTVIIEDSTEPAPWLKAYNPSVMLYDSSPCAHSSSTCLLTY